MVFQGGLADADDGPDLLDKGDHVLGLVVVVDELLDVLVQGLVDLLALIGVAGLASKVMNSKAVGAARRVERMKIVFMFLFAKFLLLFMNYFVSKMPHKVIKIEQRQNELF